VLIVIYMAKNLVISLLLVSTNLNSNRAFYFAYVGYRPFLISVVDFP
jgi:hypothetical protein